MIKPVTVNQLTIRATLEKIGSRETLNRIQYAAVLAGARSLVQSIKDALLASVPKANQRNPKYTDTLLDAIRFSSPNNDGTRTVHALGVRDKGSGTYRTRFFNKTTKDRYQKTYKGKKLKKKRFVGTVGGTFFFNKGLNQGKQEAIDRMKNAITNILNHIDG